MSDDQFFVMDYNIENQDFFIVIYTQAWITSGHFFQKMIQDGMLF